MDFAFTPEEEAFATMIDQNGLQPMVDENGMPINSPPADPGAFPPQEPPAMRPDGSGDPSQQELDQAFPPQQPQQYPRPPDPRSAPPPDPLQPRSYSP